MIGGTVIETVVGESLTWVLCRSHVGEERAINVGTNWYAKQIKPGDHIFWKSMKAYWTAKGVNPLDISEHEIGLRKVGSAGAPRPEQEKQ